MPRLSLQPYTSTLFFFSCHFPILDTPLLLPNQDVALNPSFSSAPTFSTPAPSCFLAESIFLFSSQVCVHSCSDLMEVSLVSPGERQGEPVSGAVIAPHGGRGGGRREREDSVVEGERGQQGRSKARRRERERGRERGPALTAHIAGWLAGSLTVDE